MAEDKDPTGMRHLLASLKESGPMPSDLNDRIRASLAQEHETRSNSAAEPTADEAADGSAFWGAMDEEEDEARGPRRHRAVAPWLLGAAAATVVALGVGGFVLNQGSGGSADSGAAPAASSQTAESKDGAAAPDVASPSADDEVPAFVITASGSDYSTSTVADGASKLLDNPTEFPANDDDQALGTMTTAAGATDCLARLGSPDMQAVAIDVARFDGKDGLLLVAQSLPDGPARAWAITDGCEPIWKDPIAVPQK